MRKGKVLIWSITTCISEIVNKQINIFTPHFHHIPFLPTSTGDAIKDAVGQLRPDFFWRSFPDGKEVYGPERYGDVICHGYKGDVKEGHKSIPSGHSSWTFAGLGLLAWYLSAVSRVDDYWHHWQDVFAGGFLGFAVAAFCYLQFFPPPYDAQGWGLHADFKMLAELSTDAVQSEHLDGIDMVVSAQM